jgi:hypothetical protein
MILFEARLDHLSQKLDNQMDQFNCRLDSYMEYCDRKVSNNEGDKLWLSILTYCLDKNICCTIKINLQVFKMLKKMGIKT